LIVKSIIWGLLIYICKVCILMITKFLLLKFCEFLLYLHYFIFLSGRWDYNLVSWSGHTLWASLKSHISWMVLLRSPPRRMCQIKTQVLKWCTGIPCSSGGNSCLFCIVTMTYMANLLCFYACVLLIMLRMKTIKNN